MLIIGKENIEENFPDKFINSFRIHSSSRFMDYYRILFIFFFLFCFKYIFISHYFFYCKIYMLYLSASSVCGNITHVCFSLHLFFK